MKFLTKTREIRDSNGKLHFRRYAIFECKYFAVYIHRIFQADKDTYLHDHPWNFFSVLLTGTTFEYFLQSGPGKYRVRRPISFSYYPAEKFHKIFEIDGPVTTIVFTGRRFREWGYLTENGKVSNEEYRRSKENRSI